MNPVVRPAAIRGRVAAWLRDGDAAPVLALAAAPTWSGDPTLVVRDPTGTQITVRVVPCATPLAVRAALHARAEGERLVLLTPLGADDLGDGLLAHLSRQRVHPVLRWEMVRALFPGVDLDPTLATGTYNWAADALVDHVPVGGWPRPTGTVLTRDHALRCLAGELLGIPRDQIDSAGLVQWTRDAPRVLRFASWPAPLVEGLATYLVEISGPAAGPIMAAVRAGHGADAVALGLLVGVLWPGRPATAGAGTAGPGAGARRLDPTAAKGRLDPTAVAVARTRLEPYFGGARLADGPARAFRDAVEAWIDRAMDAGGQARTDARRTLQRAEEIATQIDAVELLGASPVLPTGFTWRMRALAAEICRAIPATAPGPANPPAGTAGTAGRSRGAAGGRGTTRVAAAGDTPPPPQAISAAELALDRVREHRIGEPHRIATAGMAVRLLRWLATPDGASPATLLAALHRHVRDDGWVDRARLDIFAGDADPEVAQAYRRLHHAVDARRTRHDEQFAHLLAAATAVGSEPGELLLVEDVLRRVVAPIVASGRRVLLLVLDGMGVAAATELAESILESPRWAELTPGGGPRTGVLAALPSITEVSRCSLFSGRIATGGQAEERAGFARLFPTGHLLHKADLRTGAGSALDQDVRSALDDPDRPVVAAVVNTIDDALDRSDPGGTVWGRDTVGPLRDLLAAVTGRVVVILSDHGHVVDRGRDAVTLASPSPGNRWRAAQPPAGDGEILISGSRVGTDGTASGGTAGHSGTARPAGSGPAPAGGGRIVVPWREDVRYGPRKAGYHGGATPAEMVIPLLVFSPAGDLTAPGWSEAPVTSPAWWRESARTGPGRPAVPTPRGGTRTRRKADTGPTLFDELPAQAPPAGTGHPRAGAAGGDTTGGSTPPAGPGTTPPAAGPAAPPPDAPATATPPLVARLLGSPGYAQRKDTRAPLSDDRVAALLTVLLGNGNRATLDTLAARAGIPAHRIVGTVTALRKLLQVEGYPVLDLDPDGHTVILDTDLLTAQFHLDGQRPGDGQ